LKDVAEIKKHPFFEQINWQSLYKKEIPAPFLPNVNGPRDLRYFDKMFTEVAPDDSVPDKSLNSVQKEANKYPNFTYNDQAKF
jgi:Protein kinase C terminal domain.